MDNIILVSNHFNFARYFKCFESLDNCRQLHPVICRQMAAPREFFFLPVSPQDNTIPSYAWITTAGAISKYLHRWLVTSFQLIPFALKLTLCIHDRTEKVDLATARDF